MSPELALILGLFLSPWKTDATSRPHSKERAVEAFIRLKTAKTLGLSIPLLLLGLADEMIQ